MGGGGREWERVGRGKGGGGGRKHDDIGGGSGTVPAGPRMKEGDDTNMSRKNNQRVGRENKRQEE